MKKCKNCEKQALKYSKYTSGDFCSRECARSYSTKNEIKYEKQSTCIKCGIEMKVNKRTSKILCERCRKENTILIKKNTHINNTSIEEKFVKVCKYCGCEVCERPDICKKLRIIPSLIKYFGFNKNVLGTKNFYEEYERIKTNLYIDYYDDLLSIPDLMIKYNYKSKNPRNFSKIMNSLDIKRRNLSDSNKNTILNGKSNFFDYKNAYRQDWHITWNEKKVFYRSSYELEYCLHLDEQKIDYNMEKIRIQYWDSQMLEYRIAIPDFHIISKNKIVEIKSMWTYNKQNMIDKLKAYKEHGYQFRLILEHTEYDENNLPIDNIRNSYNKKISTE